MFELDFHEDLQSDLDKLPEDVYDEAYKMLQKLQKDYLKNSLPLLFFVLCYNFPSLLFKKG